MSCVHEGKILKFSFGIECKILEKRCIFILPCDKRCSEESHGIIHYLKAIGTYEQMLKDRK
jgi:hypothetical protein